MTALAAVEAITTATTARLSWLLGLLAILGHVPRLATVEAVSAATTTRLSGFLGFLAVAGHVPRLAAVEACVAVTALATLLAPADSKFSPSKLMTIEVTDGLLCVLLLVEVHETKCALPSKFISHLIIYLTLRRTWQLPMLVKSSSNSVASCSLATFPMNKLIVVSEVVLKSIIINQY
jgi:hypothetical protein